VSDGLDDAFAGVDARIAALDAWPDDERTAEARALVASVLELHRLGLVAMLRAAGPELASRVAEDPRVAALLVLHDVHPTSFEERARGAVLRAQGAYPDLRLVSVEGARVVVEVGARGGSSSASLAIEKSLLEQLPDAQAIEVRVPPAGLVQLGRRSAAP
jgi:hypothetical protein